MPGRRPPEQPGVVEGHRAEDDPCHTSVEELIDVGLGAHAPTALHGDVDGPGDGQHRRAVDRAPLPGGVEVDHVEPRGTGAGEAPSQLDRVPVVALTVEVALGQADRPTVPDVDGRIELHHAGPRWEARTKLARMPSPTAPDFSGWNWVPHTPSRSAEAVTGPP